MVFANLLIRGAALRAKFRTKRRNTLHIPKNDLSSVCLFVVGVRG